MRKKTVSLVTIVAIILVIVFFEFFVFETPMQRTTDPYFAAYYNEFNETPKPNYNYTFSPPVSMYHALLIALESDRWNATSLQNMTIGVWLDFCAFGPGSFDRLYSVTFQPADWSPKQVNDTTYRYVWTISVEGPGKSMGIPPPGYYWVDAATAELVSMETGTLTRGTTGPGVILYDSYVYFYGNGTRIDVEIGNSGTSDTNITQVYIGTSSSSMDNQTLTFVPLPPGNEQRISLNYSWQPGVTYYFKMVASTGQYLLLTQEAPNTYS